MNVGNSIRKSIDDFFAGDTESAMLHACNAVDGTAKKVYPREGSGMRFTRLLRDNYAILGPMGMPGINILDTRFPVKIPRHWATGGKPDLADIIYGIHRCSHGHGDELPNGFGLLPDVTGPEQKTTSVVVRGAIQLSDRIIFALIAVAVMNPTNIGQAIPDGYYLTYGGTEQLRISEWWGRTADFLILIEKKPLACIKLDFSNWMDDV